MKPIKNFLTEASQTGRYNSDCVFFCQLITNVQLSEKQLIDMLSNIKDDEIKVWIKYTQDCYAGSDQEEEANKLRDGKDLAKFLAKYPITE